MSGDHAISLAFLTSLAVGLLIGLERERHRESKAGVRTFALIAMVGTVCAMLGEKTASPWLLVAGLVVSMTAMSQTPVLPPNERRILRLEEVEAKSGFTRAHIYNLMKKRPFPQALRLGVRAVGWDSIEIAQWIDERVNNRA